MYLPRNILWIKKFSNSAGFKRIRSNMDINLKSRENPVVMKIDTPEFKNMLTPEVMDLKKIFDNYNYEIRIAGGAVRDLLLGKQPKDLDFATTATPSQMKDMFMAENVRMINMAGEKHGTITPRINDKENFEVTTLRIDMVTDGRHAEVQFTKDWKLDANRRDLTINSMFLGFDGSVYDYFFGYEDLQNRRIAFVGDPDVRIKEDYLRILRYFRFYGRISDMPNNHEEKTLEVIQSNASGLKIVSGERVWTELKKILEGKFAGEILKTILSLDIGNYIGLPENPNVDELNRLMVRGRHLVPHPICFLAAVLRNIDEVTALHNRLKFSSYEKDLTYFIVENRGICEDVRPLLPYERLVLKTKIKQKDALEYVCELLKYNGEEKLLMQFLAWDLPRFPVNGKVLKNNKVPPGIMYGKILDKLKDVWIDSDYKMTVDDLVKLIPDIISNEKKM